MAFEGNSVEFSITNTTDTRKTFYWTLEAVEGAPRRSDFNEPPTGLFTGIQPSNYDTNVTLNPGESQLISLDLKSDKLIEGSETFNIVSKNSQYSNENSNVEATISIQDAEKPLLGISPDTSYKSLPGYTDLAAAPGASKVFTKDDFKFAEYVKKYSEYDIENINPISQIISLSPSSMVLRYTERDGLLESNHFVWATQNSKGNFQEKTSYQALPEPSGHRYTKTINATFDPKGNLYSIHSYSASDLSGDRTTLLLKHNRKGKEVFQVPLSPLSFHDFYQAIATDNKNGLLISSSDHSNVLVERRSRKTGKQLWTSQPFFGLDGGGFNKSSRSIQPLDDGSFLVAASGWLSLYGSNISSYIAKTSLKDGSLQALLGVDGDSTYHSNEFFTDGDTIHFRTAGGAYEVSVNAKPAKTFSMPGANEGKTSSKDQSEHKLKKPKQYKKRFVDKISNFNPNNDKLSVSRSEFEIGKRIKFAPGKNKRAARALSKQEVDFIYDQNQGGLYYNENGASRGFGDGGFIAILKCAPDISAEHIQSI